MKAILSAILLVGLLGAAATRAQDVNSTETRVGDGVCNVPSDLLEPGDSAVLAKVANAVRSARKLDVLVVGSGSSSLSSPDGVSTAYPARLEASLREKFPGIAVAVATSLQPKQTAEEVAGRLQALVSDRKPDLLIWQTGTIDAMRAIPSGDFRSAVDQGIGAVKAAGVEALLINLQYSPRMATVLAPSKYLDAIRGVAQLQAVPLFDRYAIMQRWNDTGEFDLSNASRGFALARDVHDCLGRALAKLVVNAARLDPAEPRPQR